jgi:two-component system chemotaxis sensor kinase CheA
MSSGKKLSYEDILNTFFAESREKLEDMEASLLELEKNADDQETLNAVFRAAHTIKGSAGMFGFEDIGNFSHALENLLADLRDRKLSFDHDLGSLLFECHDFMLKLVDFYDANRQGKIDKSMLEALIHLQLKMKSFQKKAASGAAESIAEGKKAPEEEQQIGMVVENMCWHISLRFGENTFRDGFDPQSFLSYLGSMGKIVNLRTVYDSLPPLAQYNAESCYLGFEIDFMGDVTRKKLEDVFEFVKDDCKVRILPPRSNISEYVDLINDLPESPMAIGKILVETGSLTSEEVDEALRLQSEKILHHEQKLLGEIFVDEKMVHKPVLDEALKKQMKVKKSMRIDTEKLDSLINLVGELVIATASIKQIADRLGSMDLEDSVSSLSMLTDNLRGSSMNLRMVQIGDSFKRFERAVHDLCNAQGKQVDLTLKGGETEVDKTLVEKIMDPLLHIVRNAIDHGIDVPNKRIAAGKPPRGKIAINAYSEAGSVVIEVSDDGNGLNKNRILRKAVELGLVNAEEGAKLSDSELFRFVFMPGFSTAEKVTDISGRGVGMDVVMRNIDSLRGTVSIKSTEGQGATVTLRLPLTLVIIDGFMVKSGEEVYLLPLDMVNECAEISIEEITKHENGNFMNLRGELVPFIRLRDFFSIPGKSNGKEFIVIAEYFGKKAGIVVDKPLGEMQIVVKPLGNMFKGIRWLSGATILGGGDPALILDIPRLIQYVQASQQNVMG